MDRKLFMLNAFLQRYTQANPEMLYEWTEQEDYAFRSPNELAVRMTDEGYEYRTADSDWQPLESVSQLKEFLA